MLALILSAFYTARFLLFPDAFLPAVDLDSQQAYHTYPHVICKPRGIAFSSAGELAIIGRHLGPYPTEIYIRRHSGVSSLVKLPKPDTLERGLSFASDLSGSDLAPSAQFEDVAFSETGTLFSTIASYFSGAYSGVAEAPFVASQDGTWNALRVSNILESGNLTLGGVDEDSRYALNGNYRNTFADLQLAEDDPDYQRFETEYVSNHHTVRLGFGVATAANGANVSGYDAGLRSVPSAMAPHTTAVLWQNGKRLNLGPGVACDVNDSAIAVGSDGGILGSYGHPVAWIRGAKTILAQGSGSAYTVTDDASIAGTVDGHGFIALREPKGFRLVLMDALVTSGTWHIEAIYAVAKDGTMLALARHGSSQHGFALLSPKSTRK
jgi:hypothetical protein